MATKKDPLSAVRNSAPTVQVDDIFDFVPTDEGVVVATSLPMPKVRRCTVGKQITISWFSQMITLRPGDVLTEESYGTGCFKRFEDQGVQLVDME